MKTITFKINRETKIPSKLIKDAPRQGPFDEYAQYIVDNYHIDVSLDDSQNYLKHIGAWNQAELMDLDLNIKRLLWLAILECKENKLTYWYMGE